MLYQPITTRVSTTISPSTTVSTKVVVSVRCTASTLRNLETMSPMLRFSNQPSGSFTRCAKSVDSSRRFRFVERYTLTHARTAVTATVMMTSAPKATPSTVSRSRSRPTSTRSTTSCRKKGIAMAKTSSARERTRICASVPFSPRATPSSWIALTCSRSSRGLKLAVGENSIATPV